MAPDLYTPTTPGSILRYNARHFPEGVALVLGSERRTNAALVERGFRLAAALEEGGVTRHDRVAILSRNNLEFFEVYAAGWLGGATVATINYRMAQPEVAHILTDCAPKVLIFEAVYLALVDGLRAAVPGIERFICIGGATEWAEDYEDVLARATRDAPAGGPCPQDPALLIYTSGTTGRPKGCIHTHGGLGTMARTMAPVQPAPLHDKFLIVMPMFHIGGLAVALTHLTMTGTCIVLPEFDPDAVIDAIERERVGIILLAPTMVQMLLDTERCRSADLTCLHTILYSASPMPSTILRRGLDRFGPIFVQLYGQTESIYSFLPKALHLPDGTVQEQALLLSAGIPLPGVTLRIVDDAWCDVSPGEAGEVLSRTPAGAIGYWNASAATAETFRDGWTASGDIGRMDERGFVYIVDRKKDIIISGGENIYSREVEEALITHPKVAEVAVIGRPDPVWGEAVCAIVRLTHGSAATEADLVDHVKGQIASYKKPKVIIFLDALPKLVSGKVDKNALRRIAG